MPLPVERSQGSVSSLVARFQTAANKDAEAALERDRLSSRRSSASSFGTTGGRQSVGLVSPGLDGAVSGSVFTSPTMGAAERIGEENGNGDGDGAREEVLRDDPMGKEDHPGQVGVGMEEISGKTGTEGRGKGDTEEGAGGKATVFAGGALEKVKDKVDDVKQGFKNLVISGPKGAEANEDMATKVSDTARAGDGGGNSTIKPAEAAGSAKQTPSKNPDAGAGASPGATKPSGASTTKDKDKTPSSKTTTGAGESHPGATATERKAALASSATKAASAVPGGATVPRPSPIATGKNTASKALVAARSSETTGATTTSPTSNKFPAASKSPTSTTATTKFPAASRTTTTSTSTSTSTAKPAAALATSPTARTRLSSTASAGASSNAAKSPTSATSSRTPARSDSKANAAGGGKIASAITPASVVDRSTSSARRLSAAPAATPSKPGGIPSKRLTPAHTGPPRSTPRPATASHATPSVPLRPHVTGTPSKPTASSLAKARSPAGAGPDSHTTPSSAGPERRTMSLGRASGSAARASLGATHTHTHTPASTKKEVIGETDGSPFSHAKSASKPSRTSMASTSRLLQGTAASRARAAANAANSGSPAQVHGSATKTAKAGTAGTGGTVGTTSTSHITPTKGVAGKGAPGKRAGAGAGSTHSEQKHGKAKTATATTRVDAGAEKSVGSNTNVDLPVEEADGVKSSSAAGHADGSSDPPSHSKNGDPAPAPAEVNEGKTGPVGFSPIGRIGLAGAREAPAPDREESEAEVDHANAHESGQEDRVGGSEMVESADPVTLNKGDVEGGDTGARPQEEEGKKAVGDAGDAGAVGASAFGRIGLAGGKETHVGGPEKIEALGSILRNRQGGLSGGEGDETGDTLGGHQGDKGGGELGPGLQSGHEVSDGAGQAQEDDGLGEIPDIE